MKVLAGIVLYHPDATRLRENIAAVRNQVDALAVWDNGGMDDSVLPAGTRILSEQGKNIGIAAALNRLCRYAKENGYDWILTLDQDSVVPAGLVDGYAPYTEDPSVGMLCPCILDRNYGTMDYDRGSGAATDDVDVCITSASLLRLSAWEAVGGFWDELFIDMVDFDICWSLQERGFRVVRVNSLVLYHEIGNSRKVRFLGKENVVFNHSPIRSYYMARNTLAVGKEHGKIKKCRRMAAKRILLVNLFEKKRWAKDKMIFKGLIDSRKMLRKKESE